MSTTTNDRSTPVYRFAYRRRHLVMALVVALAAAVVTGSSAANTVNGADAHHRSGMP